MEDYDQGSAHLHASAISNHLECLHRGKVLRKAEVDVIAIHKPGKNRNKNTNKKSRKTLVTNIITYNSGVDG